MEVRDTMNIFTRCDTNRYDESDRLSNQGVAILPTTVTGRKMNHEALTHWDRCPRSDSGCLRISNRRCCHNTASHHRRGGNHHFPSTYDNNNHHHIRCRGPQQRPHRMRRTTRPSQRHMRSCSRARRRSRRKLPSSTTQMDLRTPSSSIRKPW